MYEPYANAEDYAAYGSGGIPSEQVTVFLRRAGRQIDQLTYNRITTVGFDHLTEFQQELVKESCCLFADFLYDNADLLSSALDSYSINGVSMKFGGLSVTVVNGVPVRRELYALLSQSGLCTANLNGRRYGGINEGKRENQPPDGKPHQAVSNSTIATLDEFKEALKIGK